MDWSRTKTIFIIVFSILNIFLYSLYLNQRTEAQNVQVIGQTSIEEMLKQDDIAYNIPPISKKKASYVSAKIVNFSEENLDILSQQSFNIQGNSTLLVDLSKPIPIKVENGHYQFNEFLLKYIFKGNQYELWEVDEELRKALFFQKFEGGLIYHSSNAMLEVYWNEEGKVTRYVQKMLDNFMSENHKEKEILTPLEAIGSLVSRNYIPPKSEIQSVTLGYSTLLQVTETQVFAPTWHVRVQTPDKEIEHYYINAIEGKVIDFQMEAVEELEESEQGKEVENES